MIGLIFALAVQASAWNIDDTTSALDGKRSFIAGVSSTNTVLNQAGRPQNAMLGMACSNGRRSVALAWPTYLGRDEVEVTWKVGDGLIRTDRFGVIGSTSANLSGRAGDRFIAAMAAEGTAVIRVRAYQDVQEASFDLTGAAAPLATLGEACPAK